MHSLTRRRFCTGSLLLAASAAGVGLARPDALTLQRLLRQVALATYPTQTEWQFRFLDNGDEESITPGGMGVLLRSGHFLTVSHAVMSWPLNRRIYHNRRFERTSSTTVIRHPRDGTELELREIALVPGLDLALFTLPAGEAPGFSGVALPLARADQLPLDGEIFLVRVGLEEAQGYTVTRGRITAQEGHASMRALGIETLGAFFMVEMEDTVRFGDSGSAIVGLPADNPSQLALYGIISGTAATHAAVLKAEVLAQHIATAGELP